MSGIDDFNLNVLRMLQYVVRKHYPDATFSFERRGDYIGMQCDNVPREVQELELVMNDEREGFYAFADRLDREIVAIKTRLEGKHAVD